MSNYEDVIAVRKEFAEGAHFGSAQAENDAYLDSITGKLNTLKQTWISILNTFANSESIKGALDVLISVSEAIDSVVKALDEMGVLLPVAFTAFSSGGALLKNLAGFGNTSYELREVGNSLQLVSTQATTSTPLFKNIFKSFKEGQGVSQKLSGSFKAIGASISSSVVPNLKAMLSAGLKGLAVSAVFTAIGWAIDKTVNKYKNLDKELQANAEASKAQLDGLKNQKSSLESMAKEYDALSKKVDKTEEDVLRFIELKHQIAEVAPDLVIGVDEDNNPILNLNSSLEDYIGNLDQAIQRQQTLYANDSMEVGKNAIDGLQSSLNWNLTPDYNLDDTALRQYNEKVIKGRSNLIKELNAINQEGNFKSLKNELKDFAKAHEDYNEKIISSYNKVKEEYDKINAENAKAQQGFNDKLMASSNIQKAGEEAKKLGAQLISAFDFSEVDSSKFDQMVFNMSKNLSSGEFDASLKKVAELRQELEKTYDFKEYESSIEQYIPTVAKFLGVTEEVARGMLKVPTVMKTSQDALDEFLRSMGKTKQSLNFDVEAQNLADQFYEVTNAISQMADASNLVKIDGKIQLDPQVVLDMENNESIPEQIRKLLGEFNTDGVVDVGEIELLMKVMTAFQLGDTQQSKQILAQVQEELDKQLGEGKVNIKDFKFDVSGKVENVNIDTEKLEETLKVFGDREEIKKVFRTEVVGLDKVEFFAQIVKNLPTNKEYTNKFIADNAEALADLETYQDVIDWIVKHPEVISKYKINVEGNEKLQKAKEDFEAQNGKKSESTATTKVKEEGADETKEKLEKVNEQADELSKDVNLSVNNGELQGSVESFEKLIEYSTKLKDGTYSISFKSDTGESINQINKLKDTINDLSSTFSSLPSITVRIETAQASQNVTGLRNNIEKFNSLSGGLKTITFRTETAQASKNVTGLRSNVSRYITSYCGKSFSTKFNTQTAQASKNVTGLRNNVASYVKLYAGKTFTTTFKTVTQKVTTTVSSGGKTSSNKGQPASVSYVPESYEVAQVNTSPLSEFANQVQSDTVAIQQMARTGQGVSEAISSYSSSMASVASRSLNKAHVMSMLNLDVDPLKELEDMIKRISNELELLDKKAELAFGETKIVYLKRQIELLQEQQRIQNQMAQDYAIQQNELKYFLGQKGFTFNSAGDVTNQSAKLFEMEKYVKQLEDQVDALGDNKNEALTKKYENAREELEKTKKALNEYIDNNAHGVVGATAEWYELQLQINEARMEIIQAGIDAKNFKFEIGAKKFEAEVQSIVNAIDLIDKQLEYAVGSEKDKLFTKKIELLKQEQKELHNLANQYREQAKVIAEFLSSKGFAIEGDGSIGNIDFLETFKDSGIYEEINEQVEKYLELTQDNIPKISQEWWDVKQTIDDTRISILEAKDELSDIVLDINVNKIESSLNKIRNEIKRLERDIDKSFGSAKESLLNNKIDSLKAEQNKLHELANAYRVQRKEISDFLNSKGFTIHPDGQIANPEFVLNFKEDPAMMQYLQGIIDKYNGLGTTIDGLSQDWWDLEGSIEDARYQIEQARKELAKFIEEAKVDELISRFNDLAHEIDLIDKKLKHATGKDKLDLLSQKLELIKEQQIEVQKQWEYFTNKKNSLKADLSGLGFTFDADGNITNYVSQLEKIGKSSGDFEQVKEKLEEYFDLQDNELPNLESGWLDLENAYKDVLKEQLNTTKEIEDKITSMYKKQVQERIDAINKETDAKIKALKKQQEAYNKYREETDYKNEYEDKLTEISDIQKQLDIAMRDTSLAGQQKVKELQKLLADAQKELNKLTQDKIDSDINDMFDKENERIEEESEKTIEELEKEWSDSKIAEMVAEALQTGIFTGIDGSVENLQDAMLKFAEETGELFGVMGTVIKSELITNLDIAKNTVAELGQIIKELDLEKFAVLSSSSSFSGTISGRSMEGYSIPSQINYNSEIKFDAPLIYIEGNVDNDIMSKLESYRDEVTNSIINKIAGAIR